MFFSLLLLLSSLSIISLITRWGNSIFGNLSSKKFSIGLICAKHFPLLCPASSKHSKTSSSSSSSSSSFQSVS
ncbi:MAG: hypothetical protein K6253_00620 [Candidatus Liberibacter asiaticus]|nr:hypothetical protein [Candidatus Liberibacter asiaticus]